MSDVGPKQWGFPGLQDSKTETAGNRDLLLLLHVEIPDDEPWKNRKGEVGSDEPR